MNCLEAQSKIVAFIEDKLEDSESLEFVRHIRSCENCAEELEIYYTLLVGMKQLDEDRELSTDFKAQMEEKLNMKYKHIQNRRKLTGSTIALIAAGLFAVVFLGYKSYQTTLYLQEQEAIKARQSEFYYSDYFGDALFHPMDYKPFDLAEYLDPPGTDEDESKLKKLLLIDGHSILNRAFYGLPDLSSSQGQHTNAILGFLNIMFKLMEEETPTHLCVAFDVHQPTFRHLRYEAYKGTRKPMPEELRQQVPVMKEVLQAMNVATVEQGGFEADDIIGTLSRRGIQEGFHVTIVSGDRDLLQLATDTIQVRIPKTRPSGTTVEDYFAADVKERYQVTPIEFIDLKGLMGDASDNIPGVPGIGEKTATKIITAYHSIENAYAHIDEIKPNKAKENLETYYEQALLSKELATIRLDCPLEVSMDEMALGELYNERSYEILKQLELKTILGRFSQPMQTTRFQASLKIMEDLPEAEAFFQGLLARPVLALQCVTGEQGLLGLLISDTEGQGTLVVVENFLTEDYLVRQVCRLLDGKRKVITIGWKNQLPVLAAGMGTDLPAVLDLAVACYLLNPLKDTYYYDDIARDILGITVPSRTELLGKTDITPFTLREPAVQEMLADQICVALAAGKRIEAMLEQKGMLDLYWKLEWNWRRND